MKDCLLVNWTVYPKTIFIQIPVDMPLVHPGKRCPKPSLNLMNNMVHLLKVRSFHAWNLLYCILFCQWLVALPFISPNCSLFWYMQIENSLQWMTGIVFYSQGVHPFNFLCFAEFYCANDFFFLESRLRPYLRFSRPPTTNSSTWTAPVIDAVWLLFIP